MKAEKWQVDCASELIPRGDFNAEVADRQARLPVGLATAEGINFQSAGERIEFAADQTVGPVAGCAHGLLEEREGPGTVGAAKKNDPAGGKSARRNGWARRACRRSLDALEVTQPMGGDAAAGVVPHLRRAQETMTPPDLGLPENG